MNKRTAKKFAVIGNPISHSLSPYIHQKFAEQFLVTLSYEKILADEDNFKQIVMQFFEQGGHGLNITTPFKSLAADVVSHCNDIAKLSNSVNTIYKNENGSLIGTSTDGLGWLYDLERLDIGLEDKNILLIGAGGAARILVNAITSKTIQSLHICNRTEESAQTLITNKKVTASGLMSVPDIEWDIIINSLSVGWHGKYPEVKAFIGKNTIGYDLNYAQGANAFKQWFTDTGGQVNHFHDGWGMLVGQAAESFNCWWDLKPDTAELIKRGKPPLD